MTFTLVLLYDQFTFVSLFAFFSRKDLFLCYFLVKFSFNFGVIDVCKVCLCGTLGAIQVLRNAVGVGGCQLSQKKVLRRCRVQRY